MGVINLTPDSFSDGNQFNKKDSLASRFEEVSAWAQIVDLGAESTAPKNKAITAAEELARFEQAFYPLVEQQQAPDVTISIDTYKIEVFEKLARKIHEHWPQTQLIFNDVSGVVDDELLDFLSSFDLPFSYVFSHNLCPNRKKTGEHMKYTTKLAGTDFIRSLLEYFNEGLAKLSATKRSVIIDPCFGFSKTREQNQILLKYFQTFLMQMPPEHPCMFGISRKSFLRYPSDLDAKSSANQILLDHMQSILLYELMKDSSARELIVRTHQNTPIVAAKNVKKMFEI